MNQSDVINLKQKESNKTPFYKVSNHLELFKVGTSFYKDYKEGFKSFAISSTGYHSSQQQTILGLASFFDHTKEDLKILVLSENLLTGTFQEVVSACHLETLQFQKSKVEAKFMNYITLQN